jgi:hypothetical protein
MAACLLAWGHLVMGASFPRLVSWWRSLDEWQQWVVAGFALALLFSVVSICVAVWQDGLGSAVKNWWREQAARIARARARQRAEEERRTIAEKQRRNKARTVCEVLYAQHAPEVGRRLSKEAFDELVSRHLGEDRTAEYVEEHARKVQQLIKDHLDRAVQTGAVAARKWASAYYVEHEALLHAQFPRALFAATLEAMVPEAAEPTAAWEGARKLIEHLQGAVRREGEARRSRERRLRQIERELAECTKFLERVQAFGAGGEDEAGISEDEVDAQKQKARDLEEEREHLRSLNEGGGG